MFAYTKIMQALVAAGVTPASTDPYFNLVTLLLNTTTTNGAQNNTFLDSSTANAGSGWTITRNGNTTQGTFTPFSQTGWSNYFDGNGDQLSVGNVAAAQTGANDFSIECFVYALKQTNTYAQGLVSYGISGSTTGTSYLSFQISATGYLSVVYAQGTTATLTDSTLFPLNQWVHAVVCRSGSTLSLFVNGTRVATASTSATVGNTGNALIIGGQWYANDTLRQLQGYLSNVRIVNGASAYNAASSTITVPTSALTAITSTSLLTCQSNRFIDNSSNAYSITPAGNSSVQAFSPFAPTAAYSTTTVGGSGYFDGTTDYLSLPANAAFNFGAPSGNTNDFTIEMWVYPTRSAFVNYENLYGTGGSGVQDQLNLSSAGVAGYFDGTTTVNSPALILNQWNHIAVVRNGAGSNNLRVYGNGVSGTAATSTNSLGSSAITPRIGLRSDGLYPYQGYISNLRVVKGTAVYTANFTPPTSLVTAISGTSVLINSVNAGIYNAAAKNDLETVSGAQVSTTTAKFGTTSMKFNGTTDYLTFPTNNLLEFGTGDFTVETWVYFNSVSSVQTMITNYSSVSTGWGLQWRSDTGIWNFFVGNTQLLTYTNTPSTNTWIHFAVARSGTSLKMFLNGTQVASTTNSTNLSGATGATTVGVLYDFAGPTYVNYLNGYLDELRITKGYARYTASFTAPTAAFPTQ